MQSVKFLHHAFFWNTSDREQKLEEFSVDSGKARHVGGYFRARLAALIKKPGVIRHNGQMARLTFGDLDGSKSPRAQKLHVACQRAKIESYLVDDIQRVILDNRFILS